MVIFCCSLGVYFTSFFDNYIEQKLLLLIKKQPLWYLVQNSCSKPIKICLWKCSVFTNVASYRPSTLLKLNFLTVVFFKDFNHTTSLMLNSYFEEYLFFQKTFLIGCCAFIKFECLIHTIFSWWNFWIQLLNLAK